MDLSETAIAKKTIPYSYEEITEIFKHVSPVFLKKCQKNFKFFAENGI